MRRAIHLMATQRQHLAAGGLLLVLSATGCAVNPVTGERQLVLISQAQEIELGRESAKQVRQSMAMVDNPELQAYVERTGRRLAAESERPDLPWSFQVVDDPTPNAFALPGGPVFITRGLLSLMDTEAELASVLGHEIGHVTARHSVAQISWAQLTQLGLGLGTIFVPEVRPYEDLVGAGLNLLMLKYDRDAERQADQLGFRYARQEGYDVSEMADVFAALQRAGDLAGQSAIPGWLATHPAPAERIEAVEERLARLPQGQFEATLGRAEFLRMIDGLAYGENPRNGFFRDNTVYHPDLKFKLSIPEGWQRQNLARVVAGVSPDRDAAFQLMLAGEDSAIQALQNFAARQEIQVGNVRQIDTEGISGSVAEFIAQTQQGAITGYVAFYEWGGRTFQLLTYASPRAVAQYQDVVAGLITGFSPLTDTSILNVEAPTIEIVKLPHDMTFRRFAGTVSSNISLERLALINQIHDVDATISAGTLLKQVRGDVPDAGG